ncbi:DUF1961 family protein [Amphibacillus sediminis]|uniref:DUF1961 family protein n=1 Tax=Amphibacillus sediminis TaxID=360185 RepID=UPI00082BE47E|nr:DUF1961 family protein [Amphibacillus sediminis]
MQQFQFEKGELIYHNPLGSAADLTDFKMEGSVKTSFESGQLVLENGMDPEEHGDYAHWVLWCKHHFPDQIMIEWKFKPIKEPGLCMLFFAATGKDGADIFAPELPERYGHYPQYHSGSINTFHLSYFRRKWEDERAFCTCNLRKSAGFHLVAQGADPIPTVADVKSAFQLRLIKYGPIIQFSINDLVVLEWEDDGQSYGPLYSDGKIGFRQMAPMKASYRQLNVFKAIKVNEQKME